MSRPAWKIEVAEEREDAESGLRMRPLVERDRESEEPSLMDLAAMARTIPPPPMPADDGDGVVDLASWGPPALAKLPDVAEPLAPSAFPAAWSAPPPARTSMLKMVAVTSAL